MMHPVAATGFGGAGLGAYEAARPGYPPAAVQHAIGGLPRGARVLDLAAGTGKLTKQLLALDLFDVTAAEPNAGMASSFEKAFPGVPLAVAGAEALPYPDASFDAVFAGQAYHWFANQKASAEMARVLKPGGTLALLWNMEDRAQPWMDEFLDIFVPYAANVPNYAALANLSNAGLGTHLAALQSDWFAALFDVSPSPAACSSLFHWTRPVTRGAVWQRVLSNSFIQTLPESEREGVVRPKVEAWAERYASRFKAPAAAADSGGEPVGMFDMVTEVFLCRKR